MERLLSICLFKLVATLFIATNSAFALPKIKILATGGTIAGLADEGK
jgi:L-asparaginase/Glu-tRNA(Gln) amidotransferase subunit D